MIFGCFFLTDKSVQYFVFARNKMFSDFRDSTVLPPTSGNTATHCNKTVSEVSAEINKEQIDCP